MEQESGSYVIYRPKKPFCRCGCTAHCDHSCLDCDNCTECECPKCDEGKGYN